MSDIPGAGSRCKGSEKFAHLQIFLKKVYGCRFIVKDLPEWDSGIKDNEGEEGTHSRMSTKCTTSWEYAPAKMQAKCTWQGIERAHE